MVMIVLFVPTYASAKQAPTVCDGLKGKAYGLCNKYCEALDCDWDPNASKNACEALKANYSKLTGESELPCEMMSLGCVVGDSGEAPPFPFDIGDGNDYRARVFALTVPEKSMCNPSESDCTIVPSWLDFMDMEKTEVLGKNVWNPKGRR